MLFSQASAKIFEILRKFADVCEKAGLDEAFLDITSKVRNGLFPFCISGKIQFKYVSKRYQN